MKILIKEVKVINAKENNSESVDILIEQGIIAKIDKHLSVDADSIIDAKGLYALPGLIDMHTHLREPGFTNKETIKTGTMAAARGGYTTVCCMPNTKPVIDCEESLKALIKTIELDASIRVYPIGAITKGQKSVELVDFSIMKKNGAIALSDDGLPVQNNVLLKDAMLLGKKHDLLIVEHCEDMELSRGGVINEGEKAALLGFRGIPSLSEELAINRDIMIAEYTKTRLHIAHISTKKSAELIRDAKKRGINITCEVTPHHIALSEDIIQAEFTDCKVNPPLRTKEDIIALKEALVDGTIDVIATDHAPHEEKSKDFNIASNGISGIETAFCVCYTELVQKGYLSLDELIGKMSYYPAKLLGLDSGVIKIGKAADIILVNLDEALTVDKNNFLSMGKNTPFHGREYCGKVIYTICNGKIVYGEEK